MMKRTILSLLVRDQFGTLTRITALFARLGCNIDSLSACAAKEEGKTVITITVLGQEEKIRQINNILGRLEALEQHRILSGDGLVEKTSALVQLKKTPHQLPNIQELLLQQKTLEDGSVLLSLFGDEAIIKSLLPQLEPYGIKQYVSSGPAAMNL
ncbi:acetolactate synthase small subunit [Clostridia bacterium OttesenSCG-928-F22]|nr:acetolactate synthase small subunit [Clostridia bacterium OttesenSCG-928-F22]